MLVLYGIKNCDTVKKARQWLDTHTIAYHFHDYRSDGLDEALLKQFESQLGWSNLLNRNSTSWRQLPEEQKADLNKESAMQLMLATPTLIKRPILQTPRHLLLGFKTDSYSNELL